MITTAPQPRLQLTMLKFRRYLTMKLKTIYRCQPGRLWVFFSLLILLLFTLQFMEKLQPSKNCPCEPEHALRQTTHRGQKQISYPLQTPSPLWGDDFPHWQRKTMPEPTSTASVQDVPQMRLYFSQETPPGSSPGNQERHWTWQPVESSKKVKARLPPTGLNPQLPELRKAAAEGPGLPGTISTAWGDAGAVTSKFVIFSGRVTAEEEHGRASPPETSQAAVQSPSQPQAVGAPSPQWGSSLKHAVPNSARPPQAEDFYRPDLERGFFPSWTEVSKVEKVTPGKGQRAGGVSSPREMCEPKTDIVFLKVHKSASSTVMNILFRFGETHNLTFAFPIGGGNQLFYPHHFLARFVQGFSPRSPRRFNILCHHMRFLQAEVQKVVSSSAVYFSILRNPVQLMESSFVYYKGTLAFSRARSLEEFLSQPYLYYNPTDRDSHYARNLMTFDFGFNPNGEVSTKRVQLMLATIEASFDLVLISEYFDESMVLLKEMLCWDLDSVVSFPLNSRDSSTKSPLPDTIVEKIKDWNRLDWEIYTHFNRTFWERVDRDIGRERLQREVTALRKRRAELARTCLQGMGSVVPKDIKDSSLRPLQHGSAKILGYNLRQGLDKETERVCRRLVTPELQYSSALYQKQFGQRHPRTPRLAPAQQGNARRHRLEGTQN